MLPTHLSLGSSSRICQSTIAPSLQALLIAGAEPDTFAVAGFTPLSMASGSGNGPAVALLLQVKLCAPSHMPNLLRRSLSPPILPLTMLLGQ